MEQKTAGFWELIFDVFYLRIFINAATGLFFFLSIVYISPSIFNDLYPIANNVCSYRNTDFGISCFILNIKRLALYFYNHESFLTVFTVITVLVILGELAWILGHYLTYIFFLIEENEKNNLCKHNANSADCKEDIMERISPNSSAYLTYSKFVLVMQGNSFKHSEIYFNMYRVLSGLAWIILSLLFSFIYRFNLQINALIYNNGRLLEIEMLMGTAIITIGTITLYAYYFKTIKITKDFLFLLLSIAAAAFFGNNLYPMFLIVLLILILDQAKEQLTHANKVIYYNFK